MVSLTPDSFFFLFYVLAIGLSTIKLVVKQNKTEDVFLDSFYDLKFALRRVGLTGTTAIILFYSIFRLTVSPRSIKTHGKRQNTIEDVFFGQFTG